ncbi:MAG TPA: hypothetical protein VNM50_07375, partial [Chloroflexota bacterium]|nr:hypothetical protein [Chloroflexota bacterium]
VRHNIVDIDQARSQVAAQAQAAETERQNALVALRETEARLRAAKAKLAGEKLERVMARTTRDNPVFVQLQQRLTQLELQRVEASQVYTAQHPRMIQLESEIAELRQRMTAEAKTVLSDQTVGANPLHTQFLGQVATLEVERAATTARLEAIAAVQSRRQAGLRTLPSIESGMAMLLRENEILEQTYAMLSQRHQEALIRESEAAFVTAGVQVMETAVVPNVPISSGLPLQTGIAGLIGLFLGVAAAIFLESTDDKIRSPQDAERTLGVPILAEVPDISPPRTAPAGAALVIALILALLVGGSLVAARASREGEGGRPTTHSMLVRLGQGLGHLTTQLSQAVR